MSTQLPFELLTLIIDIVAADTFSRNDREHDTTALRHCALVSPQFTAHCQRHLFSHIQISYDKPWAISNLQQVLDIDHTEIGSHIKVLSVTLWPPKSKPQPNIDRILDKCTQVTSLAVYCHQDWHFGVDWVLDIPKSTQIALESIIHSPMCKTLDFDGLRMPFSVFSTPSRNCGVESLSFSKRQFALQRLEGSPDEIPDQGPSYTSLRFLSLIPLLIPALLSPMFYDGRHLFDLSNLVTLWVDHRRTHVQPDVTVQLLRRTTRLRSLGFRLRHDIPDILQDILSEPAPCIATTLSEIRLNLISQLLYVRNLPNQDPFMGTLDELHAALSKRNVLKSVYVEMEMDSMWRYGKIVQDGWIRAANTFKHPGSSFPLLERFSIDVKTPRTRLPVYQVQQQDSMSGEQLAEDLLKVPFDTLDLPYKFTFSVRSL